MGRPYSDPAFGVKQILPLADTGALNGTRAADTELNRLTFMHPVSVTDANMYMVAGGTGSVLAVALGKSAAGTGAITQIGTLAIGTQATATVKDGAVTETSFAAGDDLTVEVLAGTATIVPNVRLYVTYREDYVTGSD